MYNRWLFFLYMTVYVNTVQPTTGYGFVDFDSPAAALKAVHALKTSGIQAQMAKVSVSQACVCVCMYVCVCVCVYLPCLWTSLWARASLMHACLQCVCVCVLENDIRLVTWPQLTSCSSRDPIYFHCRNQMSHFCLPNNLSVEVTC